MLVKFFRHGNANQNGGRSGGGGAVYDYLLKDKDDKTQPRQGATVFRGDPELTTEIINSIKHKSLYTSCVLSFAENEIDDDQKLNEILDSFENTLFPNLDKDQYSMYAVKHTDKGRTELHIVFANVELTTQKSLPVYYHKKDLDLIDNWKDIVNYDYDLIDPNSPDRKRDLVRSQINFDDQTDDQLKDVIHDRLYFLVSQNENIQSRADIVKTLKDMGYEVTRQGKKENSISIKNPNGGRNLKFKGELYSPTFNRDKLNKDVALYNSKRDQRIANKRQSFEIELENRRKRLETKFGKIDRTPLDNKLTHDLKAIKSNSADMAEWQRQTLKQIIAESLESVSSGQSGELQQILFDSIDSQIKDEPLSEFDQIIQNYQSRIAQHQAELAQQERLARLSNIRMTGDELRQYVIDFDNSSYQSVIDREAQCIATMQAIEQGNEPLTDDILATYKQARDFVSYTEQWRSEGRLDEKQQSEIRKAERLAEQQQRQAEQARLAQQRLEQQQFERALTEQSENLYCRELLTPEEHQEFAELDDEQLEYNKNHYLDEMIILLEKSESELLTQAEIAEFRAFERVVNSIHIIEQDRLEQRENERLAQEQAQTADTAPELVERSDEEVAQTAPTPPPDQPEQITITLNAKQQIVFDIASKYFPNDDLDEMKNYVASLSDSELRNIDNPYQSDHDKYVKLANSYAQSLHDNLIEKAEIELSKLKTLVPERPDDKKLSSKQWDKAFERWNVDRVLPESKVRNKEIELNNLRNQTVRATPIHFDKIAQNYPDLASNEQEYEHFQQFVNEVNRALTELDRQQQPQTLEQVKNSGMDK